MVRLRPTFVQDAVLPKHAHQGTSLLSYVWRFNWGMDNHYMSYSLSRNRPGQRELPFIQNGQFGDDGVDASQPASAGLTLHRQQTMDPRLPSFFHDSAMGLPYGYPD